MSRMFVCAEVEAAETDYSMALSGDILWDRIASIEYLGYEHVYDIEVEGTHNFIGNGIFAHNTYISGKGRYVYMTRQAFMELPVDIVVRILRREARIAGERFRDRRDGGGYDDEVEGILLKIAEYVDSKGLCVTGDTLLPILKVTSNQKPETRNQ